NITKHEIN
ncbi:glutamate receptor ionotropic, kainate 3, partial [Nephila pilipes]